MATPGPADDGGSFTASYYDNTAKFNPTTAVVIIVLIAGCFVVAFVSVVIRRCMRGDTTVAQSGGSPQSGSYQSKARGLEKADVDALPLVHSADLGEKDDHECPVCLTDFQPDETLRLLPSCKHVFHRECIDMWFDSHSTCPLCRASLVPGDADKSPAPGDVAPGAPIDEVSENGDSDVEFHDGSRRDHVSLEDPRQLGAPEDERTSAQGMLFRNSESFKRAARGVEVSESEAAEEESEKKPETMRRSSSLSADLINLRNLLMGADQSGGNNPASASSRWFARAKSLEHASRVNAVQNEYSREPTRDEWVTIDLETGKATSQAEPTAPTTGESSSEGPAPERSWSARFSLSSLKSLAILSRSTSDVSSHHASHLPI